jgi:thioredoxin 1
VSNRAIHPVTDETFDSTVFASELPVLVDFWATWCPPCRALAPIIEEFAIEHEGRLEVVKLDVDVNPQTAARFGVQGIPTLILFRDGQAVERIVGFLPKAELVARLERQIPGLAQKDETHAKFIGG